MGMFTGMWFSPNSVEQWVEKTWKSMMKLNLGDFIIGNRLFSLLCKYKEDQDIVFKNGLYLFGNKGNI